MVDSNSVHDYEVLEPKAGLFLTILIHLMVRVQTNCWF